MRVDLGTVLDTDPGITRAGLEDLDASVAAAHERIADGRSAGDFGYAALNLPSTVDLEAIRAAVDPLRDVSTVLTVGIGGSALGARTITAALGGRHVALDNVDPAHTQALLDRHDLDDIAVHVVSRSGTTVETLANFLVVREALVAADIDWTERTIVTTGDAGPLRTVVDRHGLPALPVPEGVPGRFSALSTMGLVPAAILGLDLEGLIRGAARAADALTGSLFDCPAYAYGAVTAELSRRGAVVNAMMPYAESLEAFAEWFAQLWAESLGKDGTGQFPVRALGATDQHSQLQLYRAGPRKAVVTIVQVGERPTVSVPEPPSDLDYLEGRALADVIDAECRATQASLDAAGRPTIRLDIDRVDAAAVGELLYSLEAACIMAGELLEVATFEQPAVEWGKNAARDLLRGATTEATRTIEGLERLEIG